MAFCFPIWRLCGMRWVVYACQQEYRIIGSDPVECRLRPDTKHPGCKIEEYGHAELDLGSQLTGFSWKTPVSSLTEEQHRLALELPQHAYLGVLISRLQIVPWKISSISFGPGMP